MKRNYKGLMSLLLTVIILTMSINPAFAALPEYGEEYSTQPTKTYSQTFTDVNKSYWAFSYISEMVDRGVLSGYPNGYFYPDNTITRAEFAKVMCLAASITVTPVSATSYADVAASEWFAPYVEAGKYYLSGYVSDGNKYYMPNDNALREDIAVALVKLKGYDTSLYDESILKAMFTDYQSISSGARKYVSVAVEQGLISGYEDNTFRGQNTITRAEAATLLWRAYQYGSGNKVFEKEDFEEPVTPVKPVETPTTKPDITEAGEPELTKEPAEVEVPEVEYLYNLKTIASSVSNVDGMVATDDGIVYLDGNKIMEVKKDANKAQCILEASDIGYLGKEELTKSQKANLPSQIRAIGYNQNDDCVYAIITQPYDNNLGYLYNVTEKTGRVLCSEPLFGSYGDYSALGKYLNDSHNFVFDNSNNAMFIGLIVSENGIIYNQNCYKYSAYINNEYFTIYDTSISKMNKAGDFENVDCYVHGNPKYFAANNKEFYFTSNSEIGVVDTNGDYKLLCGIGDIDNIDGKPVRIRNIKVVTSAVDNDGVIYYWDIDYNCIRQLEHN